MKEESKNLGELMSNNKIVLPGEQVSTSEELLPGDGTYEENGIIRASRYGQFQVDNKNNKAVVKAMTSVPVEVRKGDIVLAQVASVRSNMIIAEVIHVIGKKRSISGDTNGTLKVAEISQAYIKDPATEYSPGDIIRAKVFQVKPSIQLSTKGKEFGAIKSLCKRCRTTLELKNNRLECENCKNKERRKLANDYGNYDLKKL